MTAIFIKGWVGFALWLLIAGSFVAVEAFTPSFFLIWFAGGALIASILALFGIGEFIQVIVFLLTSMVFLAFARPIVKRFLHKNKDPDPSNVYSLIGEKALILKEVSQVGGKVKIMRTGETWSAYTHEHFEPLKENVQVIVEQVDGAKLVVVPKTSYKPQAD